jgi:hypothetical protein
VGGKYKIMEERRKHPPCDIHSQLLEHLEKDIYGNGNEGLKVKVIKLSENMKTIKGFLYLTIPPILVGILSIAIKIIFFLN